MHQQLRRCVHLTVETCVFIFRAPWLGFEATIQPITGDIIPLPCIWQEIKSQDPNIRTATFTDWDWWWYVTSMGIPGAIDFDFFCAPRLDGGYQQCDANSVGNATRYLKQVFHSSESSYTFVYLTNVDATGHSSGWCGPEYQRAVDVIDGLVGQLLDVIDKAGLTDEVTVLLNTDHGGHGLMHGSWQNSDLVVPLFVRGPGFKKNEEFKNEVRNWDMAPTALEVLGIRQSPWWKGEVLTEAFVWTWTNKEPMRTLCRRTLSLLIQLVEDIPDRWKMTKQLWNIFDKLLLYDAHLNSSRPLIQYKTSKR